MLAGIADEQHLVLRADLVEEIPHLLRRCQRGFIDHIEMLARRVIVVAMAAGKKALQGVGGNARVAELAGGAGGRGEALDRIAALLRSLADACQGRSLARRPPVPAIPVL